MDLPIQQTLCDEQYAGVDMLLIHSLKPLPKCRPAIFPDLKVLTWADMGAKQ